MEFVFNEWFLDWHSPKDATQEEKRMVSHIFDWLLQSQHRLVVLTDSPFMDKINKYRKEYDYDPFCRTSLKMFFSQVFSDPNKCRQVEVGPDLDEKTEALLGTGGTNFSSDRYLFQSAETTDEKIIITTDAKLIKHFAKNERFQLWTVETFLSTFNIH